MIRAVIDQEAFEKLVAGKEAIVGGLRNAPLKSGAGCQVNLILSDIGFPAMLDAIQKASGSKMVGSAALTTALQACADLLARYVESDAGTDRDELHEDAILAVHRAEHLLGTDWQADYAKMHESPGAPVEFTFNEGDPLKPAPTLTTKAWSITEHEIYDASLCLGNHFKDMGIVLRSSNGRIVSVETIEALAAKMRELDAEPA